MPKLHTSDLLEKFCSNEKHVYMKSVVLCAEFIAVVVYRRKVEGWGEIEEEEEREGDNKRVITHIISESLWCSPLHRELCPFLFGDDFSCQPKI